MKISNLKYLQPWHLVEASPWPLLMAFSIFSFALALVSWLVNFGANVFLPMAIMSFLAFLWWRDVVREAIGGHHSVIVQKGLEIGFLLFLISEVMVFFSLFWAYFHSSLVPSIEISSMWPPKGISPIDAWSIPLLGSSVLLASGFFLTESHHAFINCDKTHAITHLAITILLGAFFLVLQFNEYLLAEFTLTDSVFGSIFFMTTGLHALHVFAGVSFLFIALLRIISLSFTSEHHLAFQFAIIYFHLVDMLWLAVFVIFYWWGS